MWPAGPHVVSQAPSIQEQVGTEWGHLILLPKGTLRFFPEGYPKPYWGLPSCHSGFWGSRLFISSSAESSKKKPRRGGNWTQDTTLLPGLPLGGNFSLAFIKTKPTLGSQVPAVSGVPRNNERASSGVPIGAGHPHPFSAWPGWETILAPLSKAQPQAGEMAQPQSTGCFCKGLEFCSSTHTGWFATTYKSSPKVSDTSELCRYLHSCMLNYYAQINTHNIIKTKMIIFF